MSLLSTGSLGLQVKKGVSTVASINQAGAIVGTSCQINGSDVLISTYKPFYSAGRVSSTGSKVSDTGRIGFTATRRSAGIMMLPLQQPTQVQTMFTQRRLWEDLLALFWEPKHQPQKFPYIHSQE